MSGPQPLWVSLSVSTNPCGSICSLNEGKPKHYRGNRPVDRCGVVAALSAQGLVIPVGGQDGDLARAVCFNARILIMDEPTAALGPQETQMVSELIRKLKAQGRLIFLIEHDIHNVMKRCDRASVMKNGQLVGTVNVNEVTGEDILGMIIPGKKPAKVARPRPGP